MPFFSWLYNNFGLFFGLIFLLYLYLIIYRFTALYQVLKNVKDDIGSDNKITWLPDITEFIDSLSTNKDHDLENSILVDSIWLVIEKRITVHIDALNAYLNSLVLFGFAGTIIGCVNAFNNLFGGLAGGKNSASLFILTWDNGLNTALYSSLAAALFGGVLLTLLHSGPIVLRIKQLESLVNEQILITLNNRKQ